MKRRILILMILAIKLCPCGILRAEDEVTDILERAFAHDPSLVRVHSNAGHVVSEYSVSCDGKYLFACNQNEVNVYDSKTQRLILNFPVKGVRDVLAHPADPDLMILSVSSATYHTNMISQPSVVINWRTGKISGHVPSSWTNGNKHELVVNTSDTYLWDNYFGFFPYRNHIEFTGSGYKTLMQGGVDISPNDSLMVLSAMDPIIWDLKRNQLAAMMPYSNWLSSNDSTLSKDELLTYFPKPEKWKMKPSRALFNRNMFSVKFTSDTTLLMGGATPHVLKWSFSEEFPEVYPIPLTEGSVFDVMEADGEMIAATWKGLYSSSEGAPFVLLESFNPKNSGITTMEKHAVNIISPLFGEGEYLVSFVGHSGDIVKGGKIGEKAPVREFPENDWGEILDFYLFDEGKRAIATNAMTLAEFDLSTSGKIILERKINPPFEFGEWLDACLVIPDGRWLAGSSFGRLAVFDPRSGEWKMTDVKTPGRLRSMKLTHDGTKVIASDSRNDILILDAKSLDLIVSLKSYVPFGMVSFTPDGYYSFQNLGIDVSRLVHISKDHKVYTFDQFDLARNRPDIIIERLGGDKEYASLLKKSWQQRVRRHGMNEADLTASDYHVPEVVVTNLDAIPAATQEPEVRLDIHLSDSEVDLDKLFISLNGVPLEGEYGMNVAGGKEVDISRTVELASGINRISVAGMNTRGAKSIATDVYVNRTTEVAPKPVLWVVALGVSDYADSRFSLEYGAKDASDFAALANEAVNTFSDVKTLALTDDAFTSASLPEIERFLADAGRDDAVIMFFAGHGVLDDRMDYYLAPFDMDFSNPRGSGIAIDRFTSLLNGCKALKRYVIVDACHSGGVDKENYLADNTMALDATQPHGGVLFRNVGNLKAKSREGEMVGMLADDMFTELTLSAGATFISSAKGDQVSVESDEWGNGLFTYCLKEGLSVEKTSGKPRAMRSNSQLSIETLAAYASARTAELSGNAQTPRVRSNNNSNLIIIK